MDQFDDDLSRFAAVGAPALPPSDREGYLEHEGARIWFASFGSGLAVILLHGGLGHSGNWGYQVPVLIDAGYRVLVIDSRGHGRSTRDERPFSYELMASDVLAIMDELNLDRPALVGWSDGACTALVLAAQNPARVAGVFFFACNMDPFGTKPFTPTPAIDRCFNRHTRDYARLSPTPESFRDLVEAVSPMQRTQPNYRASDLARIATPVTVVHSEHDEFIYREHAEYLARTLPNAELRLLPDVSHFAPLQRPRLFNAALLDFAKKTANLS